MPEHVSCFGLEHCRLPYWSELRAPVVAANRDSDALDLTAPPHVRREAM
jgi:hypothetical protein